MFMDREAGTYAGLVTERAYAGQWTQGMAMHGLRICASGE